MFIFISAAFGIIALDNPGYSYSSLWWGLYVVFSIITLILFGVMQILWGAAHINSRRHTGNSGLALATGIMLIISGTLTMSIIITFVGMILFFVSEIIAAVAFIMASIHSNVHRSL